MTDTRKWPCARHGCIALAVEGQYTCAVHQKHWNLPDRELGLVRQIVPVTTRIEREQVKH